MSLTNEERAEIYLSTALYPIAVVQDRYRGTYSRGLWIAVAEADRLEDGATRIYRLLEGGPHGGDTDAMIFWDRPPAWIAVGNTPDESVSALLRAHRLALQPTPGDNQDMALAVEALDGQEAIEQGYERFLKPQVCECSHYKWDIANHHGLHHNRCPDVRRRGAIAMTPLPVDPRCDIDLVDVMRAIWHRQERGEKDDLAGLLAAGRKPTLVVCEKLKDGKR